MTDKEFEEAWIDVCAELRMSMDGVYFEAAVMLAKKAIAAEREACAKVCSDLAKEYAVYRDHWPQRNAANECARMIFERSNCEFTGRR